VTRDTERRFLTAQYGPKEIGVPQTNEIVAELHRLLDQQTTALEGRLSPEEAIKCGMRAQRITELLGLRNEHEPAD
jgi:hypothetical protein